MYLRLTTCALLLLAEASSASLARNSEAQLAPISQNIAAQATSAAEGYPVSGVVINSVTGEPIRNALVWLLFGSERSSLLTGPEGRFRFDSVPLGAQRITVQKPGFFSEQQLSGGSGLSGPIQVGPDMPLVTLKLVPEGVIFGRITDSNGEPVEELPVKAFYDGFEDGRRTMRQQFTALTNADGEFRIFELRPGTYYLSAGRFTTTFYPGVRDVDFAAPIRVAPGQQMRVDLQIQPGAFYNISGVVIAPTGVRPELELLSWDLGGGGLGYPLPLEKDGSFMRVAAAGPHVLRATAQTSNGELAASVVLNVASDIAGIRLALAPTATIPVNVDFELTRHTSTELANGRSTVAVTLVPKEGSFRNRYSTSDVRMLGSSPEPRTLALRNIEMGAYRAELDPFGPWYVAAARRGATDLLTQDLVVDSGGEGEPIEVTLRDDFASIQGSVTSDGQPPQGTVVLIPQRPQERTLTIPVDAAGHFRMDSVSPGEYTAIAFDRITNLEYRNAEVMRSYASGVQVVRVPPGGEASVNLRLQKRQEY
jgi:carboxypeptidase family protein